MPKRQPHAKAKCAAPMCEREAIVHGLCGMHNARMVRRGSLDLPPEATPDGEPMAFLTGALTEQTDSCIDWPFAAAHFAREPDGSRGLGYGIIRIAGRTVRAHVFVCEAVYGARPVNHEAAHRCGRRCCINHRHLRWATRAENQADRVDHGTSNRGERQWMTKLTPEKVLELRRLAEAGTLCQREAAERLGVGRKTLNDAIRGRTWAWLTPHPTTACRRPC